MTTDGSAGDSAIDGASPNSWPSLMVVEGMRNVKIVLGLVLIRLIHKHQSYVWAYGPLSKHYTTYTQQKSLLSFATHLPMIQSKQITGYRQNSPPPIPYYEVMGISNKAHQQTVYAAYIG